VRHARRQGDGVAGIEAQALGAADQGARSRHRDDGHRDRGVVWRQDRAGTERDRGQLEAGLLEEDPDLARLGAGRGWQLERAHRWAGGDVSGRLRRRDERRWRRGRAADGGDGQGERGGQRA
jgi:hypothetical protein